jgi:hypothetical protein
LDKVEKNMLIGAFATGAVDLALEGYYAYNDAQGINMRNQFPYVAIHEGLPPVDDLLALGVFPLAVYALGKYILKKPSLVVASKGGMIYGASELIGQTVYRLAKLTQTPSATYRIVP